MKKHCAVSKKPKCSRTRGLSVKEILVWRDKTKVWQQVSCFFARLAAHTSFWGLKCACCDPAWVRSIRKWKASPADFGCGVWLPLWRGLLIIFILHHLVRHGKMVFLHSFAIGYSPPRFMSRGGFCLADKSRPPPHTAVAGGMGGGLLFREL